MPPLSAEEIKNMRLEPLYEGDKKQSVLKFSDLYEFEQFLGKGGFGQVVLAKSISNNK